MWTTGTIIILTFFAAHWLGSVFSQTFFLHRYGAHRMFSMSKGWERFFYLVTYVTQGSSFLNPRGYAILHREHHAFSDTEQDPHSPVGYSNPMSMMLSTKARYDDYAYNRRSPEARFDGGYPSWPALDRLGQSWAMRILWCVFYAGVYFAFADKWWLWLLLPIHFVMGPVHGAIVNWCGHRYGYANYNNGDQSRNSLFFDFVTFGELFQNNHHRFGMAPNFAVRWFEVDPGYVMIRLFKRLGIIEMPERVQKGRYPYRAPVLQPAMTDDGRQADGMKLA